jgi:hypothetical protein
MDPAHSYATDVVELNQLAYRYAAAADAGDIGAFVGVFHPEACLRSYQPDSDEPFVDLTGHEQLAMVPDALRSMFRCTAHQMMNHLVEVEGDEASGTVLCTARHLSADRDDRGVMTVILRYHDRYERRDGTWRISDREIRFLWTERHDLADPEFPAR